MAILDFIKNVLKINSENDAQIVMPQAKETRLVTKEKEVPSCEFTFREDISEAELQELIRKRDEILNSLGHFKNYDGILLMVLIYIRK